MRVEVLDPDYSPEMPGRLAKLEGAISKQRTVKFEYWSISRDEIVRAHAQPVRAHARQRRLVRRRPRPRPRRHPHVPRLAHPRRDQVRDAPRARLPHARPTSTSSSTAAGRRGRSATSSARRASRCRGDTAWWVQRAYGSTGRLEDGVFITDYSSLPQLASWVLRQDGRAVPLEPDELRREVATSLRRVRDGHEGKAPEPAREAPEARVADDAPSAPRARSRRSGSPCCRRCSPTCSPRAARTRRREIPAAELLERFPSIPPEELEEHLSLLNLVNFGGGCYTIYAELRDGVVHVDKELWGDTFRMPPRLTPLEARAIRLALEYVGPMIAADAHTPLDKVRKKLEETFGAVRARADAGAARRARRGGPDRDARARPRRAPARRDRVPEGGRRAAVDAARRGVLVRARAAALVRAHVGPHERRRALVPARPHAQREAAEARSSSRARASSRRGCAARAARACSTRRRSPATRSSAARASSPDGGAFREIPVGSDEWLESEILSKRGEAIVLEPDELRSRIAARARELAKELGVERLRATA